MYRGQERLRNGVWRVDGEIDMCETKIVKVKITSDRFLFSFCVLFHIHPFLGFSSV